MTNEAETWSLHIAQAMKALLAVLIADREERITGREPRKTEVLLADAGLSYGDIAQLTGRPYETVKTTVRRARANPASGPRPPRSKKA